MRRAATLPLLLVTAPLLTWAPAAFADEPSDDAIEQRVKAYQTIHAAITSEAPAEISVTERYRFAEPFDQGAAIAAKAAETALSQQKSELKQFLNDTLRDAIKIAIAPNTPLIPVTYSAPMDEIYRWMLIESTFAESTRMWPAFRAALAAVAAQKNMSTQFDEAWPVGASSIDFAKLKTLMAEMTPGPRVMPGSAPGASLESTARQISFYLPENVVQSSNISCDGLTLAPSRDDQGLYGITCAGVLSVSPRVELTAHSASEPPR